MRRVLDWLRGLALLVIALVASPFLVVADQLHRARIRRLVEGTHDSYTSVFVIDGPDLVIATDRILERNWLVVIALVRHQ